MSRHMSHILTISGDIQAQRGPKGTQLESGQVISLPSLSFLICARGYQAGRGSQGAKEGLRNLSTLVHEKQLLKARVPVIPGPETRPESPWGRGREQPLPPCIHQRSLKVTPALSGCPWAAVKPSCVITRVTTAT